MAPIIKSIQELYNDYAFLVDPSEANGSGAEVEAITSMKQVIKRSYGSGKWYFMTFKPLDRPYSFKKEWYDKHGIDKCRKILRSPDAYLFTREIDASKDHINALVCSGYDLTGKHDSVYCNKYKIYCKQLSNYGDRARVLDYITKESQDRSFIRYIDYIYYDRFQ